MRSLIWQQVFVDVAGDGPLRHPGDAGSAKLCAGIVHALLLQAQGSGGRGEAGAGAGVDDSRRHGRAMQTYLLDLSAVPGEQNNPTAPPAHQSYLWSFVFFFFLSHPRTSLALPPSRKLRFGVT